MSKFPHSILVVRLGAIGDVVNALVFATAVKQAQPATRIGWAVHPLAAPLVEGHPSVDRVHLWPRAGGWSGWKRLRAELRGEGYEVAVDLQRILKSALLARASGAGRVVGFDRRRAKEGSWLLTHERIPPGPPRTHMLEGYLEFARHLGIDEPGTTHLLPADEGASHWAAQRVEELGGAPVLLNLGASKPRNRWPAEHFGRLARELSGALDVPLVFTGGPTDRTAADRALRAAAGSARDWVGQTTLRQLYHLMDRSRLFIGCDTGPMHLAVARGLPTLALFGPADPARTGPLGTRARVLRALDWRPEIPFEPCSMGALDVGKVLEATLDCLKVVSGPLGKI